MEVWLYVTIIMMFIFAIVLSVSVGNHSRRKRQELFETLELRIKKERTIRISDFRDHTKLTSTRNDKYKKYLYDYIKNEDCKITSTIAKNNDYIRDQFKDAFSRIKATDEVTDAEMSRVSEIMDLLGIEYQKIKVQEVKVAEKLVFKKKKVVKARTVKSKISKD